MKVDNFMEQNSGFDVYNLSFRPLAGKWDESCLAFNPEPGGWGDVSVPLRGSGMKDDLLRMIWDEPRYNVSVPLRGSGMKVPFRPMRLEENSKVSVPLRGSGMKAIRTIDKVEATQKQFPSPCGEVG